MVQWWSKYETKIWPKKLEEEVFSIKDYASLVHITRSPQSNVSNAWKSATRPKLAKTNPYANTAVHNTILANVKTTQRPNAVFDASNTN
jgi:hypothetical protein